MTFKEARILADKYAKKFYPGKELLDGCSYIDGKYYTAIMLEDTRGVELGWPDNFMQGIVIDEKSGNIEKMSMMEIYAKCNNPNVINKDW